MSYRICYNELENTSSNTGVGGFHQFTVVKDTEHCSALIHLSKWDALSKWGWESSAIPTSHPTMASLLNTQRTRDKREVERKEGKEKSGMVNT